MRFPIRGGIKGFGYVCGTHDRLFGRRNLIKLAGMTLEQAIEFERTDTIKDDSR